MPPVSAAPSGAGSFWVVIQWIAPPANFREPSGLVAPMAGDCAPGAGLVVRAMRDCAVDSHPHPFAAALLRPLFDFEITGHFRYW